MTEQTRYQWNFLNRDLFIAYLAREVVHDRAALTAGWAVKLATHADQGFTPRQWTTGAAGRFIKTHAEKFELVMSNLRQKIAEEVQIERYSVEGLPGDYSPEEMVVLLGRYVRVEKEFEALQALADRLKERVGQPLATYLDTLKPKQALIATLPVKTSAPMKAAVALKAKTRVTIAGVHDKHHDHIEREFPHLMITWLLPRDNDAHIKTKASGHICVSCTHGTNGRVISLLNNISKVNHIGNGVHFVKQTLATLPRSAS